MLQLVELGADHLKFHTVSPLGETGSLYHLYTELGGADKDVDAAKLNAAPLSSMKPVIGHGRSFLVWNGSTIDGKSVGIGEQAEPLTVHVTFLESASAKTYADVTVPKSSTLVGLKSAIGAACGGLPASVIDVFTISGSSTRRLAVKVADKRVNGAPAKLGDLGIKHDADLIAERSVDDRGKSRARPLAFDEVLKRDKVGVGGLYDCRLHVIVKVLWNVCQLVDLYVEDHTKSSFLAASRLGLCCTLARFSCSVRLILCNCSERMVFQLEKDAPLSTLRALLLSKLGVSQDSIEGGGRFRKSDGLLIGALIEDESDTVQQVGMGEDLSVVMALPFFSVLVGAGQSSRRVRVVV